MDSTLGKVSPVGSGSSPVCFDQKENLLKVQDKKNVCKMDCKGLVASGKRLLEVVANTNPTTHPTSESLVAQS